MRPLGRRLADAGTGDGGGSGVGESGERTGDAHVGAAPDPGHLAWQEWFTKVAARQHKVKAGDDLREMVPAEAETLAALIMGVLP